MSQQEPEVLRISLDELESAAAPVTTVTPHGSAGPRSYGTIHEPAEPVFEKPDKANFFLNAWVYLGIAGLCGALVGWCIAEPGFVDGGGMRWGNVFILPSIVTLMCAGLGLADSLVERSARKAAIRIGIALPLGLVLGFVFDRIANMFFNLGLSIDFAAGVQSAHNPAFWITRSLAWAVFGVAGGVVYGIIGQSGKKTAYGALGGAIGAAIGGLIFDPITFATKGGAASRGIGFALFGLSTGIAIGLVESALKDRWLYVTSGPLAGKQFILYKPETRIGSQQSCDIYLFKDPEILPDHALLMQKAGRIHLQANGPVYIGGQRIHTLRILESGSIIQVGRYAFRYQEKLRQ